MKFVVDEMMGRLAKWLRILGYDTVYMKDVEDNEVLRVAFRDGRILLTRDAQLLDRIKIPEAYLVKAESSYLEQLKEVLEHFDLPMDENQIFTRCLQCNVPIHIIEKSKVIGKIPPYVAKSQAEFKICPNCQRIFWPATHYTNTIHKLREMK